MARKELVVTFELTEPAAAPELVEQLQQAAQRLMDVIEMYVQWYDAYLYGENAGGCVKLRYRTNPFVGFKLPVGERDYTFAYFTEYTYEKHKVMCRAIGVPKSYKGEPYFGRYVSKNALIDPFNDGSFYLHSGDSMSRADRAMCLEFAQALRSGLADELKQWLAVQKAQIIAKDVAQKQYREECTEADRAAAEEIAALTI